MTNELTARQLEEYGEQARLCVRQMEISWLQLGRLLIEVKGSIRHGDWLDWLDGQAQIGERTAQKAMACYRRFGNGTAYAGIEKSKLEAMLALPEGTEQDFMTGNDVRGMSARETGRRVRETLAGAEPETQQPSLEPETSGPEEPRAGANDEPSPREAEALEIAHRETARANEAESSLSSMTDEYKTVFNELQQERQESRKYRSQAEEAEKAARETEEKLFALKSREARGDAGARSGAQAGGALLTPEELTYATRDF